MPCFLGLIWGGICQICGTRCGVIWAPGLVNMDAFVARTFTLSNRYQLQFCAEDFNFANSAHYGVPSVAVGTPGVGQITSDAADNREFQFALRLLF